MTQGSTANTLLGAAVKKMPLHMTKIVIALLALSPLAGAKPLKFDPIAGKGCSPHISLVDAQAAISRSNLKTSNARPAEVQTLGTVLKWIERLNDNRPLSSVVTARADAYTFNFMTNPPCKKLSSGKRVCQKFAEQQLGQISVLRKGDLNMGENAAQLVHELGHLIGINGGYSAYDRATKNQYCIVSAYSGPHAVQAGTNRRHEQFAEVFAAFVTRPEFIVNNHETPKACKLAFDFFTTQMFKPVAVEVVKTCVAHQNALVAKSVPLPPPPPAPPVR